MEAIDNILTIEESPIFNNSVQKENLISVFPTSGSNLNENGAINFIVETFDQYLLPSKSFLYLEGSISKSDKGKLTPDDKVTLTNNAPMFLFDRVSYDLNGNEVENIKDPGRATLMKGILSYSSNLSKQNTFGWILEGCGATDYKIGKYTQLRDGQISFCIPLSHIFGFAECYNKIIYGVKHSLSLHRTSNNKNTIYSTDLTKFEAKFSISKLVWMIPKIIPSLEMQNRLMNLFEHKNIFKLPFISRQLEDINVPMSVTNFTWKLGTKFEKIKYFVIGFQSHREDNFNNAARFDHCNLETIFIELNSERYPYECIRCNFAKYNAVQQYDFAKNFKNSYFSSTKESVFIDEDLFCAYYPLFVVDVSKQNERIKNSRPDITIKAGFSKNIPADTKCYCLILSDSMVEISGDGLRVSVKNN